MLIAAHPWSLLRTWFAVWMLAVLSACGGNGSDDSDATPEAPTLVITTDAPGTATGPFTVRFVFSAAVSSFASNRILISGGFLNGASLTKISDTLYTLVVTPTPDRQGAAEITVQAGGFKDSSGVTASPRAYGFSQPCDTVVLSTEPLLTLSHDATGAQATGAITFTLNFSVDVDFSVGQLAVTGGTLTSFTKLTSTRYTVVVTPPAATTGLVLLQVQAGSFASAAGVASTQDYAVGVFYATP
jgi:large repetitive protein